MRPPCRADDTRNECRREGERGRTRRARPGRVMMWPPRPWTEVLAPPFGRSTHAARHRIAGPRRRDPADGGLMTMDHVEAIIGWTIIAGGIGHMLVTRRFHRQLDKQPSAGSPDARQASSHGTDLGGQAHPPAQLKHPVEVSDDLLVSR